MGSLGLVEAWDTNRVQSNSTHLPTLPALTRRVWSLWTIAQMVGHHRAGNGRQCLLLVGMATHVFEEDQE